ncbi:MAG: hypothetical protein ACRC9R_02065 [Enterovibrio sp.]
MFPNQTPPTTAGTDTTPTTTQTAATTQGATGTNVTQAVVSVTNTATLPVTTTAGATRRPPAQGARFHPYTRPIATAPLPAASTSQSQQVAEAASTSAAARDGLGIAAPAAPLLMLRDRNETADATLLAAFFEHLASLTGVSWDNTYTPVPLELGDGRTLVGHGSVSVTALSFSNRAINRCTDQDIQELMRRVNAETNLERKRFLLVKAMRACSECTSFSPGLLICFGILVGLNSHTVPSWGKTLPDRPTAASISAPNEQLTLHLPVDVLDWPELVRIFREQIGLRDSLPVAAASIETAPSTMQFIFSEDFIRRQETELRDLMNQFNCEMHQHARNFKFVKIINALKDIYDLPSGIFSQTCNLLKVLSASASSWYSRYRQRIARRSQTAQPATATASHVRASAAPALNRLQSLFLPALTVGSPPSSPLPSPPAAAAVLSEQEGTQAAAPVFATPVVTARTATAQLAPVVQPFDPQAMSLDELLEQGSPQAAATESLDINMDLDDEEILGLFDD